MTSTFSIDFSHKVKHSGLCKVLPISSVSKTIHSESDMAKDFNGQDTVGLLLNNDSDEIGAFMDFHDKIHELTHESGWTIRAKICADYYAWVEDFEAEHPVYGRIHGNFSTQVWANSKIAYDHFVSNHPYDHFDKGHI
jgi:hypothetical protein